MAASKGAVVASRAGAAVGVADRGGGGETMQTMSRHTRRLALAAIVLTCVSSIAEAQWVMLARRAVGRVEQMSQQAGAANGPAYDTAAVLLEAPPDKVYAAVLRGLRGRTDLSITREDAPAHIVQFTNGAQIAGINVTGVGDNLTHVMITSAHVGAQPDAAALVLNAVLRVCKDMNVECSQARQ